MKYITVLRHATAVGSTNLSSDFNRELTEEGKTEIKHISDTIVKNLPKIDIIISSSAIRTKQTTEILAESINYPINKIRFENDLYNCTSSVYFDILLSLPITCHHVVFVGHNPEISDFAGILIDKVFDNLDKCEFANVSIDTFNWHDVDMGTGKLLKRIKPEK